tara:strand:+ start:2994 stop:5012 length:2019 start_codon:yes stop_codon:yes gene_type:complete
MRLAYIHACGFRGYKKPIRIDFSDSFTIIDGRNGVGKSTIFDAVEFALTGTISKYLDAKSGRESVADYLWWSGDGTSVSDRFVEVGFSDGKEIFSVRRTPTSGDNIDTGELLAQLIDLDFAPKYAMAQLCSSTIIRDEHIARLSLDMKEGERFTMLRDAIGAVDAEEWIRRAQSLTVSASARVKSLTNEAEQANQRLTSAVRQIDQARAELPAESLVKKAASRLQDILRTRAAPDQLHDLARQRMALLSAQIEDLSWLMKRFGVVDSLRSSLRNLDERVESARQRLDCAKAALDECNLALETATVSTALSEQARQLEALVNLGRRLSLRNGHCPLCESAIDHDQFGHGLEAALQAARQLDARAVEQAEKERARDAANEALVAAEQAYGAVCAEREHANITVSEFDLRLTEFSMDNAKLEDIADRMSSLESERQAITDDLHLIDTISVDRAILRAASNQESAKEEVRRVEFRLGRARLAETRAKAMYDAVRRAAAETVDQRLGRVLPLMSELYKRLRPHPVWDDIEYSVRGDVNRFLKLQVGGDINPQFVFSSGQRRATGLAFLLSVNLSITWSRWKSILLDDPVQHVDDFRTVHLAELLAHLCESGRQIICSVEDGALADLMCRRLPASEVSPGKRITLGTDRDGALTIISAQQIVPMNRRVLVLPEQSLRA